MSTNFSIKELTKTNTGILNSPDSGQLKNLDQLSLGLEWVRFAIGGRPMIISSGFRSEDVNIAVGGSKSSAHLYGYAADFTVNGMTNKQICECIIKGGVKFDQLIDERSKGGQWVHISFDPRLRGHYLVFSNGKYEAQS